MSVATFFETLQSSVEPLSLALGAFAVIASSIAGVCVAYFKYRGSEYVRAKNELLIEMRKLEIAESLLALNHLRDTGAAASSRLAGSEKPIPLKASRRAILPKVGSAQHAA